MYEAAPWLELTSLCSGRFVLGSTWLEANIVEHKLAPGRHSGSHSSVCILGFFVRGSLAVPVKRPTLESAND